MGSNGDYEIDMVIEKENGKAEGDSLSKKEMLDEKLKKIDEVFKMVSEIYRNGENQLTLPPPLPYVFYL